jgi:hypothetical protein
LEECGLAAGARRVLRLGAGLWLGVFLGPLGLLAGEVARLASAVLQVGVDSGTGQLVELIDRPSGHNFALSRAGAAAAPALWTLELMVGGATRTLQPAEARRFECQPIAGESPALRLTWSDFAVESAPGLRVEITGRMAGDEAGCRWELVVSKPRDCGLQQVVFPRLTELPAQADEFLAVPAWMGELLTDPRATLAGAKGQGVRLAWEYPGRLSLQCLAYYRQGGPGLYLACDDAAAFRKTFVARGDGHGGLGLEVAHLPENGARGSERYAPPYGVIVGTFRGDWITAAERYRAWATQQTWARSSRRARGATPPWAEQTALWIWNRGRSGEVLRPAAVLQRELGLPVSVLWHWWHGCAYDTGFPEYLPPREGAGPFRAAMAEAHERGVHAMVYMNQRLWGLTTPSWQEEGAERYAVKGSDGTYRREVYNTFTKQACVSMCMGTAFWRNTYAGLAERAIKELAVDGIYMDQACSSLACFDATHGHPLGGGTYWMNGFRQLSTDIRERSRAVRPIALAGEGTGEAWLPYLDLMLSLEVSRERYASPASRSEPIPFFQAVYHPYTIQFGNYSSLTMPPYDELWPRGSAPPEPLRLLDRKYSRQFCLEQARAFVWGQQPMLANFRPTHLQERPEEIAYVLRLARLRQRGLDYLLHGEFLRPPALNAPEATCDMSRLSIYAGQQGGLTSFTKRLPQAVAGAWRAPNGNVAVALASIADEALALTLTFDPRYHGVAGAKAVFRVDESGRQPLGPLDHTGKLNISLPPRGACLVEFVVK